jgi:hypothetical protein
MNEKGFILSTSSTRLTAAVKKPESIHSLTMKETAAAVMRMAKKN